MKLSVITVCRNNLEGLNRTWQSVNQQSARKQFEWIIVDGASTDATPEFLRVHDDEIDHWISEPDAGIYNAMNKGVRLASGEYLLFLNSGDILHDDKVMEKAIPLLYDTSVISGSMECDGSITEPVPIQNNTFAIFFKDSICHPATFIKRNLLMENPYDEQLKIVSDWKFWIEALVFKNESYKTIPVVVSSFESIGISCSNQELVTEERNKVLKEMIPSRILDDYKRIFNHSDGNLYWYIMNSRHRAKIYSLIVRIFKITGKVIKLPLHVMKLPDSFQ